MSRGGFISFDQATLDVKPKTQGVVIGKEVQPDVPPVSVEAPVERVVPADLVVEQPELEGYAPNGEPIYRSTKDMPLQHSGTRSDGGNDADVTPPRRPGSVSSEQKSQKSSGKKPTKKPDAEKQTGTAQIRDFPRSLLAIARAEFPDATNNTDALAAYLLAKSGRSNLDVPESVSELVKNWEGDKTLENMEKRMNALSGQMAIVMAMLQEMELLTTFIAFDRLGYRQDVATDVRSVDFLESGVTDLMARLREQTKLLRKQDAIKNGRPIR